MGSGLGGIAPRAAFHCWVLSTGFHFALGCDFRWRAGKPLDGGDVDGCWYHHLRPDRIGCGAQYRTIAGLLFCRAVIATSWSFQEVILAIFFVKLFGFGPFAGFVTLTVATVGFFAKLLAEDIEDMDASQSEAVRATGGSWFQWLNYGIQPQVMPRFIGLSLYRLDINFRESAIVGIVGGGGIGATLNTAFDRYEFGFAAANLLVIIGIVMMVEYSSGYVRRMVQ